MKKERKKERNSFGMFLNYAMQPSLETAQEQPLLEGVIKLMGACQQHHNLE